MTHDDSSCCRNSLIQGFFLLRFSSISHYLTDILYVGESLTFPMLDDTGLCPFTVINFLYTYSCSHINIILNFVFLQMPLRKQDRECFRQEKMQQEIS